MAGKNKNPSAKYAFIGLVIALIACISTALTGIAKGIVSLSSFTLERMSTLDLVFQISIALIVVGLAAYAMMAPDTIRRFITGRQARYGSNSLILALAFIGVIFMVNYLVYQNPGEPLDMTQDKSNTLAPETLQALETLPDKVTATAFYSSSGNLNKAGAEEILIKFKTNSKGKFDYEFVDPDQNPVAAREAGITGDGKILLTMGDTKEIASYADEIELTRTMIRLISPDNRAVYFLEGHGEAGIESNGQDQLSFSIAAKTLISKNYTVNALNLLVTNKVPEDALAIIIAGPQKPLTNNEVSLLKKFVDAGGSLVVMENPLVLTEFNDATDPLAEYLQTDWGISLNDDIIFDPSAQQVLYATSLYGSEHPITQNLSANFAVVMPQARSIGLSASTPEGITLTSLILTSESSWGETELTSENQQYQYDEGKDFVGPLTMGAAGENTGTQGRVVVFGNSLFATDDIFDYLGNGNFFINSVDWAAEQEDLLNITPREPIARFLKPISNWQLIIMVITAIFVLPGLVVFAGVSTWLARRKRG